MARIAEGQPSRRDVLTSVALAMSQSPELENVRVTTGQDSTRIRFKFEGKAYELGCKQTNSGPAYEKAKEKNKRIQAALRAFKKQYPDFYNTRYEYHKQYHPAYYARSRAEHDLKKYRPVEWQEYYDQFVWPDRPPRPKRPKNKRHEAFKLIREKYRLEYDTEVTLHQQLHSSRPKKDAHTVARNILVDRYKEEFNDELERLGKLLDYNQKNHHRVNQNPSQRRD